MESIRKKQNWKRLPVGSKGLLSVLLIAVVLIATFLFFQNKSVDDVVSTNIENMKELSLHDERVVYNLLDNYTNNLRTVGTILKKDPPESLADLTNRLGILKSGFNGSDYIALVASDGMCFQSTGIAKTDTELFSLCQVGGDNFIVRYDQLNAKAIENQKITLLIGIRVNNITVEGHDIEYIVCITPSKYLQDNLKIDSYDGQGYSAIIEKNGNYLLNVNRQLSYLARENFFDNFAGAGYSNFTSDAEFQEAVRNCTVQFFTDVRINGESFIIVFSPMKIGNWLYVTSVPKTVFEHQSGHLTSTYLTMMGIIILAVFGAMFTVFRSANKERKHQEQLLRAEERAKDAEIIKEQNDRLEQQQQVLEQALDMANAASRAKTTFLNNMSHDIRTPMNAIIGYTGLASSHIDSKEQVQDYLGKISQSSEHLLSLINDVLDMSRIESGKMTLAEKDEDLAEILHTLRNIVQADVNGKQLDFFIDCDVRNQFVVCDKLRLNQVLLNILSNSIKYTQAGGTVSVRVKETGLTETGYGKYEFRIKDNGMGMSEEFLKTIFDPFTRVNSTTVSGIQGTGLGMAITKNIVDMMGGTIHVQSKEGEGTETTVSLEFKLAGTNVEPPRIAALEGLKSLVVDDDISACRNIAKMLRDAGMRSEWCASGKEAVIRTEDALSQGELFKVYIIDWIMPDMNGIETTRRIRQIVGDQAPIIVLTAYDWSDIEEEAKKAGVTAFISKPLFPTDLRNVLNQCCGSAVDAPVETETGYDFAGKKILLVEDNEMNREIATEILEEDGFVIDTAEDGSIAVEKMKAAVPGQYDLILMDVQMPVMDGYTATKQIRALPDPAIANITIIAMTANAFEEDRQAALAAGMDGFLTKPVEIDKLKTTLAEFLNR